MPKQPSSFHLKFRVYGDELILPPHRWLIMPARSRWETHQVNLAECDITYVCGAPRKNPSPLSALPIPPPSSPLSYPSEDEFLSLDVTSEKKDLHYKSQNDNLGNLSSQLPTHFHSISHLPFEHPWIFRSHPSGQSYSQVDEVPDLESYVIINI